MAAARGLVDDNRGGVMEFFVMTGKATSDCHLEFMCPVAIWQISKRDLQGNNLIRYFHGA